MPPSQTPRNPPTWWLKNVTPESIASQRVPNITTIMPLVGGTVESHIKPMTAPNMIQVNAVIGNMMKAKIAAAEVEKRQQVTLGHVLAEPAGAQRTNDIEQPDRRQRPAPDIGGEAAIGEISRQVHGDESQLKPASEKAEHQQDVGAMPERFAERLSQRL